VNGSPTGQEHIVAAIQVSGEHTGSLDIDMTFDNTTHPVPTHTGAYTATYDGQVAPTLPDVGPCYSKLPRANPLMLEVEHSGHSDIVTVSAEIEGDHRPVQGAEVSNGHQSVTTDANGRAVLRAPSKGEDLVATAGYTFVPAHAPG
jgi:hypothetical protein